MTFKFSPKFNTNLKAKDSTSNMFKGVFAREIAINEREEYEFDHSKIHTNFDNNLQSEMILGFADYGNARNTEIKDKLTGYFENDRNSELIAHIGRFENADREGWSDAICPVVGATTGIAVSFLPLGLFWRTVASVAAGTTCVKFRNSITGVNEEASHNFFDDGYVFEDDPGADEDQDFDPANEQDDSENEQDDSENEQDDSENEQDDSENQQDDSDIEHDDSENEQDDSETDNDQNNDGQDTDQTGESTIDPMDDGQSGNDDESDSSFDDVNSDINYGPDGQNNESDSPHGGPIDQLDPITNWGPNGKPGDAGIELEIGINNLDPRTNWGDTQSEEYIVSNFSQILSDINPTHNGSNDDYSSFVESMTATGDFF